MSLDSSVQFEDFDISPGAFDDMPERDGIIEALKRDQCPQEQLESEADRQCFDLFIAASRVAIKEQAGKLIDFVDADATAGMIDMPTALQLAEGQVTMALEAYAAAKQTEGASDGNI